MHKFQQKEQNNSNTNIEKKKYTLEFLENATAKKSIQKIRATVPEQYICKIKCLFHGKIFSLSGVIVLSSLFFSYVVQGYNYENTESCHVLF